MAVEAARLAAQVAMVAEATAWEEAGSGAGAPAAGELEVAVLAAGELVVEAWVAAVQEAVARAVAVWVVAGPAAPGGETTLTLHSSLQPQCNHMWLSRTLAPLARPGGSRRCSSPWC